MPRAVDLRRGLGPGRDRPGRCASVLVASVEEDGGWSAVEARSMSSGHTFPTGTAPGSRSGAPGWIADGSPEGREIVVEDLLPVVKSGSQHMDRPFAVQWRPNAIEAGSALSWDARGRELGPEGMNIDLPGENPVAASGLVRGLDFGSTEAMQVSAEAMPAGRLVDGSPEAVERVIAALPQGRGRLPVMVGSDGGPGLARLGLLALVFGGTRASGTWTPGLLR